jgi:hypothetical protein
LDRGSDKSVREKLGMQDTVFGKNTIATTVAAAQWTLMELMQRGRHTHEYIRTNNYSTEIKYGSRDSSVDIVMRLFLVRFPTGKKPPYRLRNPHSTDSEGSPWG